MNSLTNAFAVCPAFNSPSAAAFILTSYSFNAFNQLFTPNCLICFLLFLSTAFIFILYIIEFKGIMTANDKPAVSCLSESKSNDQLDADIHMKKISHVRHNKRPSIDASEDQKEEETSATKVKSPKLLHTKYNLVEEPQKKIKSRRNSLPKSPFKTIVLDTEVQNFIVPLSPKHKCIPLIIEDKEKDQFEGNDLINLEFDHCYIDQIQEQLQGTPFEWYLHWDVPADELESLCYSERSARFFHLTKYGEIKIQHHPAIKPPEGQVVQVFKKPINLISDIVASANNINIPEYIMRLLKQNHLLTSSLLKGVNPRKEDYCITSVLRGKIDYSMLMAAEKYYMKPTIKYSMPVQVAKLQDTTNMVQWGKPLTKEQLGNIFYIIG